LRIVNLPLHNDTVFLTAAVNYFLSLFVGKDSKNHVCPKNNTYPPARKSVFSPKLHLVSRGNTKKNSDGDSWKERKKLCGKVQV
jgi:hypothetical protein